MIMVVIINSIIKISNDIILPLAFWKFILRLTVTIRTCRLQLGEGERTYETLTLDFVEFLSMSTPFLGDNLIPLLFGATYRCGYVGKDV